MTIRATPAGLTAEDDDYAFQLLKGDVERLALEAERASSANAAEFLAIEAALRELQAEIDNIDFGPYLQKAQNLADVDSVPTARTNLGLGSAAEADSADFLQVANDLSDLNDVPTARGNLGLGTMATQAANNVAITGGSVTGITDLAIADGGTGASTAADARTNLGLGALATLNTVGTAQIDHDAVTNAKLRDSDGMSIIGRAANSTGDPADILAGSDGSVLRRSGSAIGFGQVVADGIGLNQVTNDRLRDSAGLSVIGRATTGTGDPADIVAGSDYQVLRRVGTGLAFGQVHLAQSAAVFGLLAEANGGTAAASLQAAGLVALSSSGFAATSYTSGSGTHTFTRRFFCAVIVGGGGGGGGGTAGTGSGSGAGDGGGAGGIVYVYGVSPASATYACGSGGAGGAATAANGSNGGDTTLFGANITAYGGARGLGHPGGKDNHGGLVRLVNSGFGTAADMRRVDTGIIAWGHHGAHGGGGRLASLSYDGGGAVTGYQTIGGFGGGSALAGASAALGTGGDGGNAGAAGVAGTGGYVAILEWD
jgi:hypothetical protein